MFEKMTSRGRGSNSNKRKNQEDASGESSKKPKSRGNPFWRARGFYRGGFNRGSPYQPKEKPVTMQLPEPAENFGENDVKEIDLKSAQLEIGCFGNDKYRYYKFYFPDPQFEYDEESTLTKQIKAFEEFFAPRMSWYLEDVENIRDNRSFPLNYESVIKDNNLLKVMPNIENQLLENSDTIFAIAGLAFHTLWLSVVEDEEIDLEPFHVRLTHHKPIKKVSDATSRKNMGDLMSVRGVVMRVSETKLRPLWQCFKCQQCGKEQLTRQNNGKRAFPTNCPSKECKYQKKFSIVFNSPYHVFEPFQTIRLQECHANEQTDNRIIYVDVVLKYDLTDTVQPGDDIVITGIHHVVPLMDQHKEYVEACSITHKNSAFTSRRMDFTKRDMETVEKIKAQPSVFRLLVNSLQPDLRGLEMVKAGLVLSLFSGSPANDEVDSDKKVKKTKRENVHVFLVGDPGMGKSELLNACCKVAPKSFYSIGTHVSGAGLTGIVRRSKGVVTIDAGALVMAHGGICCIDEIDKKTKLHSDLLDAMERQKIAICKVGANVQLNARCTIIAAGNPVTNLYNRAKTVSENLKINPALLSRFDLVFIMIRDPNAYPGQRLQQQTHHLSTQASSFFGTNENFTLEQFLELKPDENFDPLPHELFQSYIGYARTHCNPKITQEGNNKIVEFYMELQKKQEPLKFFEIQQRQLHGLRRLAIARARVDLSDEVTLDHIQDVIDLTRYCLIDVFTTPEGELEERGVQGSGMSNSKQKKLFLEHLRRIYREHGKDTFHMKELRDIRERLKLTADLHDIVDSLNLQNLLMMVNTQNYKVV